jgi:exopolysaccharide biosynthesis protein
MNDSGSRMVRGDQRADAAGLSRDGRTLTLFTVDRAGGSDGMRVGEVADLQIRDYGVWNALNLDGGGSTTMAIEDPATHEAKLVNASSDNPRGRSVSSSLAIFASRIPKPESLIPTPFS